MSIVTELALFKACVENPIIIKSLSCLNLDSIPDPQDCEGLAEDLKLKKKAMKLFHLAWSGITKAIKATCQMTNKCVELPGFAIFSPVISDTNPYGGNKLSKNTLNQIETQVVLLVGKDFIDSLEGAADVKNDQQFAFVYDKQDQEI